MTDEKEPGTNDPVDPADGSGSDAAPAEGSVRLVKGGVTRGRRSPSRRAVVAGGAGLALLVAGGVAVGVWQLRGDGGNEVADLAASDSADVAAIGTEVDRGWRELESVRVRIDSPSEPNLTTDIRLTQDGRCAGTFGPDGSIAEVRSVDGTFYYSPGEDYWQAQIESAQAQPDPDAQVALVETLRDTIGDRWVDGGATDEASSYGEFCAGGVDALVPEQFDASAFAADGWTVGGDADVDGTPVVSLVKEGTATLFVAAEGEPWVLRAEVGQDDLSATYTFSEQNEPLDVEAPPEDEIVTVAELEAAVGAG